VEKIISREALSGSLEQLTPLRWPAGAQAETFSNIKTSAQGQNRLRKPQKNSVNLVKTAQALRTRVQPRHFTHASVLMAVVAGVFLHSPAKAQAVTIKLATQRVGYGAALDNQSTAAVVASVAAKSNLLVASQATETAKTLSQQVALATTDGQDLAKPQVVSTAGNATRDITTYKVQPGDTVSGIATKFGITTSTILWANNVDDPNAVHPGDDLTILPTSGLLYTVQSGDTADSLAGKFQANAAQIVSYNNAEVSGLQPGMKIIIPDGVKQAPVAPAVHSTSVPVRGVTPTLTRYAFGGNGYAYGYCTWYVASRRSVPAYWGDAVNWYYNAQASGFRVGSVPVVGAIAWTPAGYYGHVAIVDGVSGGMVTISEMNGPAGWGRVDTRTVSASDFRYIY
jgi:surface antigen/LysM repeat protein